MPHATAKQLFAYADTTFIENIIVRPNGKLLLTSTHHGQLMQLDPSESNPQPRLVADLTGSNALSGIASIGHDVYAVSGGVFDRKTFVFTEGSLYVYVVSFIDETRVGMANVKIVAEVPGIEMMNGMTSLTGRGDGIILSADSRQGRIVRVNTQTGAVDVSFQDPLLAMMQGRADRVPCGVNGIKFCNGQLYFVSSAHRVFGRVRISDVGDRVDDVIDLMSTINQDAPKGHTDDDFDIDSKGIAWVARHPGSLVRINLDRKEQEYVLGDETGDAAGDRLENPTSVAMDRARNLLYIVTGGSSFTGGIGGGQVVRVDFAEEMSKPDHNST